MRSFLLYESGINHPPPPPEKLKVVTPIGQQIIFNFVRRRSKKPENVPRHVKERETPATLYMSIKLFLQTSSASLVETMHNCGLCVEYDRLKTLNTGVVNSVISHREHNSVVVPSQVIKGVFTIGIDNMVHNPSSATVRSALHGTSISIQQHFDTDSQKTENLIDIIDPAKTERKQVKLLLSCYTSMDLDIVLPSDEVLYIHVLHTNCPPQPASRPHTNIIVDEYQWKENVNNLLDETLIYRMDIMGIIFCKYHRTHNYTPAKSYLLPLFTEYPTSHTMA